MNRRARVTAAAGLLVLFGCGYRGRLLGALADDGAERGGAGGASGAPARAPLPYLLGADLSFVQEQEDQGLTFVEDGRTDDVLDILARHGLNAVRLRLFHDPSSPCRTSASGDQTCGYQHEFGTRAEPYCDLEHTLAMARRVEAAGLRLLLAFHYSDTWADPDDQNKPLAWEGLSFDELVLALAEYTRQTLRAFAAAGVTPDLVQLGNEITPGFLFPDGSSSAPGNFPRFAALLRAAIEAAREAVPGVPVMLHLEKPDDLATSEWWLDAVLANGVDFEVLGQSCYPEWHGSSADWIPTFTALAEDYPDLEFVVAEYSQERRAINDMLFALPDRRGLGSFVWEPTAWGEVLFDRVGDQLVANDRLSLYDAMAEDYATR